MKLPRRSISVRVFVAAIALVAMGSQARLAPRTISSPPLTSIDLSTFVRVGRFDLPEPTRTAPPANSLLAQEASGVTYNWDTDTLFVVGDGGTSVVQVSKTGVLINSMTLGQSGSPATLDFADTEGITYAGFGQFVLVEERLRQVNLTDSYGVVQPAGPVIVDADGRFSFTVALEASRRGQDKDGRRYDVTVTALDNAGNRGSATVPVTVPHDRGK